MLRSGNVVSNTGLTVNWFTDFLNVTENGIPAQQSEHDRRVLGVHPSAACTDEVLPAPVQARHNCCLVLGSDRTTSKPCVESISSTHLRGWHARCGSRCAASSMPVHRSPQHAAWREQCGPRRRQAELPSHSTTAGGPQPCCLCFLLRRLLLPGSDTRSVAPQHYCDTGAPAGPELRK